MLGASFFIDNFTKILLIAQLVERDAVVTAIKYQFSIYFRNPAPLETVCTSSAGKAYCKNSTLFSILTDSHGQTMRLSSDVSGSQPNVFGGNFSVMEELIVPGHMLNLQVSFPIRNERLVGNTSNILDFYERNAKTFYDMNV